MAVPNFLVIGSSRGGTTTLYHHLRTHPDVYVTPVVEPRFFAFDGDPMDYRGPGDDLLRDAVVTTENGYTALFGGVRSESAIGEVSPAYLCSAVAADRIRTRVPDARIVAVLRNPVDRAVSSFRWERLEGTEPAPTLTAALDREQTRHLAGWSYVWRYGYRGHYLRHLRQYYDRFPPERIMVFRYEDWYVDRGRALLANVYRFLGVDPAAHRSEVARLNTTDAARFSLRGMTRYEPTGDELRRLYEMYSPEWAELEELTGLDLSPWRNSGVTTRFT